MSEIAQKPESPPSPSPWRRLGVAIGALFIAYLLAGYLAVPAIVESQLVGVVGEQTGLSPSIDDVRFDPFGWRLEISGFELLDPDGDGPLIAFDELAVDFRPTGFLSADVALDEVVLVRPRVEAVDGASGELNLKRVLAAGSGADSSGETAADDVAESEDPLVVDVGVIRIEQGRFAYRDEARQSVFDVAVDPFDLEMEGFTTRSGSVSACSLKLRIGDRAQLLWSGTIGLDPIRSDGHIELSDFDLGLAWDYFSEGLRFEIREGGLRLAASYEVRFEEGLDLFVREAEVGVSGLEVVDLEDDGQVLSLPALAVRGVEASGSEVGLESLAIADIAIDGGRLATRLEPDGGLHLLELLAPAESGVGQWDAVDATTSGEDANGGVVVAGKPSDAGDEPVPKPDIRIDAIVARGFEIDFEDRSAVRPVPFRAAPLDLRIEGYRSEPGSPIALSLASGFGATGQLEVSGPLRLDPLETRLRVKAERIGLRDFQPYLEGVARLDIPSGRLGLDLEVAVADEGGDAPRVAATGRVEIADLLAIDRASAEKFLEWKSLRLEGIDFAPNGLALSEIGLDAGRARIVFGTDGVSNLEAIFAASEGEVSGAPETDSAAEPLAIRVDKVSLDGLDAVVEDRANDFTMQVDSVNGTIKGLSSRELARAKVAIAGRIGEAAPIEVSGQINPLSGNAFTDLRVTVAGVSLPAFSAYSARYLGYRIERGKLDLDLDYELNGRTLVAENRIKLNRFSFGVAVESQNATTLPVPLAVALLRDRAGDIEIGLPIRGNLDDPSFSILGLLRRAAARLVTRVATTPFALIGGLVGASGADLGRVVFAPGSEQLSSGEDAELEILATALMERPSLHVQIRGRVDPGVDGPALRRAKVEAELQRAAFQDLSQRERERIGDPEAVELSSAERFTLLEKLYRERTGERARELLTGESPTGAAVASASEEARTARLVEAVAAHVELGDSDWRALARARAVSVQTALVAAGAIDPGRVFLVDVEVGEVASGALVPTQLQLSPR